MKQVAEIEEKIHEADECHDEQEREAGDGVARRNRREGVEHVIFDGASNVKLASPVFRPTPVRTNRSLVPADSRRPKENGARAVE